MLINNFIGIEIDIFYHTILYYNKYKHSFFCLDVFPVNPVALLKVTNNKPAI